MLAKNHVESVGRILAEIDAWERGQLPRSWNVVAPPCFGAGRFADDVHASIIKGFPNCKVAVLAADGVRCTEDFYAQIGHDWGAGNGRSEARRATQKMKIAELLSAAPQALHVILIREFHKILDALDEPILSALRDEEQAGMICTVAFSIYPHDWIKRAWRQKGGYFGASNYGDTHARVLLMPRDDLPIDLEGVPRAAVAEIAMQTGMYPEAFDIVLADWRDHGCRPLTYDERKRMGAVAEEALAPLCQRIDYGRSRLYADIVRRVHMQIASDEDVMSLERTHPWAKMLVKDRDLRAYALGGALAILELREAIDWGRFPDERTVMLARVGHNYEAGNYEIAERIARQLFALMQSSAIALAVCHAELMRALIGGGIDSEVPCLESNWRAVVGAIQRARVAMESYADDQLMNEEVVRRYDELEQFGQSVLDARKVVRNGRLIDTIGGLYGDQYMDRTLAYRLVTLQLESSRTLRGNGAAVKSIGELPEQMMRLWGLWRHGINYYNAPRLNEEAAGIAAAEMGMPPDQVRWPGEGARFQSLKSFCCYCYALELAADAGACWSTSKEFHAELAFLESRNDMAHATIFIDADDRMRFYAICDRWHDRIAQSCDLGVKAGKEEVLRMFAPLPLPRLM